MNKYQIEATINVAESEARSVANEFDNAVRGMGLKVESTAVVDKGLKLVSEIQSGGVNLNPLQQKNVVKALKRITKQHNGSFKKFSANGV